MIRANDFDLRLARFVASVKGREFVWGETNCLMLALRAIDAMCTTTLADTYRPAMSSSRRADAWVRRHGFPGLVSEMKSVGLVEIGPAFVQVGDVGVAQAFDTLCAHVFVGPGVLSSTPSDGVVILPLASIAAPAVWMGVR